MRYSQEHKSHTKDRIIHEAGRLFRLRGVVSTGVDTIMAAVGLTPGGFYAHFKSKQDLVSDVLRQAFRERRDVLQGDAADSSAAWLKQLLRRYLSARHRDEPEKGCPMASLLTDLGHMRETRPVLAEELESHVAVMQERGNLSRDQALALFALLAGAVAMARAVGPGKLSDDILEASRGAGALVAS